MARITEQTILAVLISLAGGAMAVSAANGVDDARTTDSASGSRTTTGSLSGAAGAMGSTTPSLGGPSASTGSMGAADSAAASADIQQISGRIASIDPSRNMVTIQQEGIGGSTMDFEVDLNSTDISRQAKDALSALSGSQAPLNLRDLQPGDPVMINYLVRNGRRAAQSIVVNDGSRG
jgi:hypothetical protein